MNHFQIQRTDMLVIGAGGAGLRAAIEAAENGARVLVVSKGPLGRSGITPLAQAAFQAPLGYTSGDTPAAHFTDTVREGRYLGDENLIAALSMDAGQRAKDLATYGTRFRMTEDGKFRQNKIPGQSTPMCLTLLQAGQGLIQGLKQKAAQYDNIRYLEDTVVLELLTSQTGVAGAIAFNMRSGQLEIIQARAIVLATGGYQELWRNTDTAPESAGDGIYLGLQAGCRLVDMEQMLFYPVVVCHPPAIRGILIPYEICLEPEYVAGKILNGNGEEFLPVGSPPARDVMLKNVFAELQAGRGTENGCLLLDLTASPKDTHTVRQFLEDMIPMPYRRLKALGFDLLERPIEVAPVAHYSLGGIQIDEWGTTCVPCLFAAGEVTGNVHGANRLSGNALAETQVFGYRAGKSGAERVRNQPFSSLPMEAITRTQSWLESLFMPRHHHVRPGTYIDRLKTIMWTHVGPSRSANSLHQALSQIDELSQDVARCMQVTGGTTRYNNELIRAFNLRVMLRVAEAVIRAALVREESRGHHFREDFPETDNEKWLRHTVVSGQNGCLRTSMCPVKRMNMEAGKGELS